MRFTISDMLWLTALVAIGAGWWLDHRNAQRRFQVIRAWAGVEIQDSYPIELFEDLPPENLKELRDQVQIFTPADRKRWAAELEEIERRRLATGQSSSP